MLLGAKFDCLHALADHAAYASDELRQRSNILKKLAGTSCGCSREVLLTTCKAVSRSALNYMYVYNVWDADMDTDPK